MQIIFLGTGSGTEPIRGYRHMSFALKRSDDIFVFDAGESCSYTAHTVGVDLLSLKAVFISHCHLDHIGGLANLIWTVNKLDSISRSKPSPMSDKKIKIFIPNGESFKAILKLLEGALAGNGLRFAVEEHRPRRGMFFCDAGLKVIGKHNRHIGAAPMDSFSFRIEYKGESIVYSGDVKRIGELGSFLDECSLLLFETGHHRVEDVCCFIREHAPGVKMTGFVHHGVALLSSPEAEMFKAREILGEKVFMARDGMIYDMERGIIDRGF